MPNADLDRLRERLNQRFEHRTRELQRGAHGPMCAEGRMGCTFRVGQRVFDRVSGEFGEVVSATRENVIVPAPE